MAITNKAEMIIKADVEPSSVADHEVISIVINIRKPKQEPVIRTLRSHRNYSQNIFCNLLLDNSHTLNCILDTDNINWQVDIFTGVFNDCLDECAPIVTIEIIRPPAPWIDDDLKRCIHEKNELKYRLKYDRSNQQLDDNFRENKKMVEHCLRTAKKQHFTSKFLDCKGDSGSTWKVVEDLLPGLKSKGKNVPTEDPHKMAEDFNQFFATVGENAFVKSQEGVDRDMMRQLDNNDIRQPLPNIPKFRPQPVDINTVILT